VKGGEKMAVNELTREQLNELKQAYATEVVGAPSYLDMLEAEEISDSVIFDYFSGVEFCADDFWGGE
jgi:hypothetical protein